MKPNAVFSNLITRNENSDGQSNISLSAPSPINVNSNESNRAIQNLNSRFAVDETKREKMPADFLRQILIEQPIGSSQGKPEPLEMKLDKPPQKLTAADYNRAAWRAVFKKAGYGILTDGEIQQAVGAMRDNKLKTEFEDFNIDNLRRYDAEPGPMFLDADKGTIESAKRAGQAVLQYQEYKAKGTDAAIESGKNYVNGALGGFVEKPYNAVVNNINGLSEPFRAGEKSLFGTGYIPELPRSTIGDKSAYWQQNRYGVSLNQMGEGATTLQVGIMTGKPLLNSRVGALLGVQVGAYNIGVGAGGTDPLNPNREVSSFERGTRIIGGTMGVASAPFSAGGRALANDALTFPNAARNTVNNLDEIFKPPTNPPLAPAGNVPNEFRTKILTGKTPLEKMGEPLEISISSEKANLEHIQKGRQAPYGGTRAREIILENNTIFVRVHGENNQTRSWMMRAEDIEGLTAQQIKDKFALPELPKYVSDVYVPKGTRIITGKAASQEGWGKGGGIQYELKDELPTSAWKYRRLIR